MQTAAEIIRRQRPQSVAVKRPQPPSPLLTAALTERFGSVEGLLQKANPSMQPVVCQDQRQAFFAQYPTLRELNLGFGRGTATKWLYAELFDLSEYCGKRNKMSPQQTTQLAGTIALEYPLMKISEFMLFCLRFKAGRYGQFYDGVDPLVITCALRRFWKERAEAWYQREQEAAAQRLAKSREGCVTWQEYCRMRGKDPMQPPPNPPMRGGAVKSATLSRWAQGPHDRMTAKPHDRMTVKPYDRKTA